ncbi:MAG: ABC transporter permease subunit, partial [Candidatus Microthrix parvicella]
MTSVRRSVRSAAALAPTWTLITLGVLVPLAALMWGARTGIAGSVDSSVSIGARLARTGRVTLIQAGASTVATLVVGLPVAWVLARFRFFGRGLIRALVAAPFVLPSVVVGAAVLALAGPSGPFGSFAPQPGSAGSLALVVFAHVGYELVVVVVIVGARLESMPSTHVEAARTMGAGSWRRGASIVVPQVLPAVAGAGALVFLL